MRTHIAPPAPPLHRRTRPPDSRPSRPPDKGSAKRPLVQTFVKLTYECDTTGAVVEYEVPSDARTVKDLWSRTLTLACPYCRDVHGIAFRSAFIRGSLATGPAALPGD